jgi:NAD(P)-dependent dehydrogenase (short-subunit alcohol dehydrogenase family)
LESIISIFLVRLLFFKALFSQNGAKAGYVVNNAGNGIYAPTLEHTKEQIEELFSTNVFGAIYLTQAVVPHMPAGGRIINISSIASKMGISLLPIYGATKAALDSLTYAWASEVYYSFTFQNEKRADTCAVQFGKSQGITVNSVAPGPVLTDKLSLEPEAYQAMVGPMIAMTRAADRIGTVEDLADTTLLLVSEKARWITGQFISASGGMTGQ